MLFKNAVISKVEQWSESVKKKANLPIRADLWGEHQIDFGHFVSPTVTLKVKDESVMPLLLAPSLGNLGHLYVEEKLDVDGPLHEIIACAYHLIDASISDDSPVMRAVRYFSHDKGEDKRSIAYHYDVSNAFYQLWLDRNMVYSCAYFEQGNEDLESAQLKKIDHILTKIQLQRGQTLLDIGCGWGALVIRAAQKFGARCVGITLSEEQYQYARDRVKAAGLEDRIEIRLQDYRDVRGRFDRITSVGMFEHVGRKNLTNYFGIIQQRLNPNGLAMNHGITSTDPEGGETSHGGGDFIDKYVFPQGELPHLSQVIQCMQQAGLETFDVENLRRHYVRTLQLWSERYEAQTERIRGMVDEKSYRIWRIYLAGCAHAFAIDQVSIYQVLCRHANTQACELPLSRDYMYEKG
ncbi:SAM-dependent methyltransferase [Paludibacterium yongneupense]|nr:cyclopropane-fatty-acyl-phospholipid synthase family protein [Paludibacterium yongneupense]